MARQFDIGRVLAGGHISTVSGKPMRFVSIVMEADQPLVVFDPSTRGFETYNLDGQYRVDAESQMDLVNVGLKGCNA